MCIGEFPFFSGTCDRFKCSIKNDKKRSKEFKHD